MTMAAIALVGLLVSVYLTLFKLGYVGTIACGTGGCETVQLGRWGTFLGLPVAAWGAGYYALILALSLVSIQPRFEHSRTIPLALVALTGWGMLFTAWLTYLELFVIHAICRWCVGSAVMVVVLFAAAWLEWRATRDLVPATD